MTHTYKSRGYCLAVLAEAVALCIPLTAQFPVAEVRITSPIDEAHLVTLRGNTHPLARVQYDRGPVSPGLSMSDLVLVLRRSPEQQAAFDEFVASQYNPSSPNYHKWLSPEEVGEIFGPAPSDIAAICNWLSSHGISIDEVSNDHMSIRFNATASQVESTFHTEIHNLEVEDRNHIGNMTDPQIPSALVPVVVGVKALHNFFPHPLYRLGRQVAFNHQTKKWERIASANGLVDKLRDTTSSAVVHAQFESTDSYDDILEDVTPYDFATIYNILPLWNVTPPIDGTGQSIAIAATSNINRADIAAFRSIFGLPLMFPIVIVTNTDPGSCSDAASSCIDNLIESTTDVEWAGAVAKGANILLVVSDATSSTTDSLYLSESYIVQNKTAPIMSVSYGECELDLGTAGNAEYNNLWQTASTEGIAVFVAAGDSGSAACDDGLDTSVPYAARYGLAVNGLASTSYNTAVGGTDLNWGETTSPYWSTTNNSSILSSALGYIPEVPWNDTCVNPLSVTYLKSWANFIGVPGVSDPEAACNFVIDYSLYIYETTGGMYDLAGFVDITGGSGGSSACTNSDGASISSCMGGYDKPTWQSNVPGILADQKRDIPDVSFFASDGFLGSAYLICVSAAGSCTYSDTSEPTTQEVGGTSVATATMAGAMALVNQKVGVAQGSPNTELYFLASRQTYSSCSTEAITDSSACYFNDIDLGTNAVPCQEGTPNCIIREASDLVGILSGYSVGTGYDLATGLGSLNVANVVNAWPAMATVIVTPTQTSITAGQSLSVTVKVNGSGATPTGTVVLSGGGLTTTLTGTLSSGSYTFTIPAFSLGVGIDTLTVTYSGDTNYISATGTATETVIESSYSLAATPVTITAGRSANSTVTVTSIGGYTGTIALTCTVTTTLPGASDLPTCSGSTVTISSGSAAGTGIITVSITTTSNERMQSRLDKGKGYIGAELCAPLAFLFFFGIPARKYNWRSILGALMVMAALGGMTGCCSISGVVSSGTDNPGATYTVTVTGTGTPSVSPIPTTTFTLTVN